MTAQTRDEVSLDLATEIALFDCRVLVPVGTSLRLDQPCVREHGSIGGWLKTEEGEVALTLLWRRLRYWNPSAAADVPGPPEQWDALNEEFIEAAVTSSRKDAARTGIEHQWEVSAPLAHHGADIVLDLRPRRRRMQAVDLRRRQLLWTCPESQRHMAFEVSMLKESSVNLDSAFERFLPTLACHSAGDPRGAAAEYARSAAILIP
jgi:hypothetical protein